MESKTFSIDLDQLVHVDDAVSYLGISKTTLYNMLRSGLLPGLKLKGTWIMRRPDLEEALTQIMEKQMTARRKNTLD